MSAKKQIEKEIREAYIFLREKNMSVPSEALQFMLDASLEKLQGQSLPIDNVSKRFWHFDCWDRTGAMQTITIEALNEENATIIFKAKHEDLGFDPPY